MPAALARIYDLPNISLTPDKVHLPQNLEILIDGHTAVPLPKANTMILDLRTIEDFRSWSLLGAKNIPLKTLNSSTISPFKDAETLEKQWLELASIFSPEIQDSVLPELIDRVVLVLCYDGDTSRVATSILQAQKVDACSLGGGIRGLFSYWETHKDQSGLTEDKQPSSPLHSTVLAESQSNIID